MDQQNPEYLSNKQEFANFLEPEHGESPYTEMVNTMVNEDSQRLIVDLNHINQFDAALRNNVLQRPMDFIPAWEDALREHVDATIGEKEKMGMTYRIGLEGNFGGQRLTPQRLMSQSIGTMVCVEGIVTKVSLIRPKVMETVHFCEATSQFKRQTYRDSTSLVGLPTGAAYPRTDDNGNPLTTEFGLCSYMDHQSVFIQDMPERTEAGSMPQSVECILDDDLVDACKPGDRVQMIGIFRALAGSKAQGTTTGRFKTVIIVNNVKKLGIDDQSRSLSVNEIKNIKKIAKNHTPNVLFNLISRSIAPSLYGHSFIKKAILLQLLGGLEKNLDNGTHIRGDINILMVGDPSCGKSQLLRAVMNIAPLAINTTGRGSSGVGLTAAVNMDRDSGERRLEAGAMVLADRGIVCIDEFDKMSDADRTAIHEVMEQQTVTIAKAGIHTSLNARCSVIAAANPVYGMYDRSMKPHQNIALPDSLLSRFDLLFIVLDKIDTEIDRAISDHVLAMHLTPHRDHIDSAFDDLNIAVDDDEDVEVYAKGIPGGHSRRGGNNRRPREKYLTIAFCKKYIEFAKKQYKPKLTDEACELIAKKYAELREAEYDQTLPITARCLETIIRLSTAHAKLRLSKTITEVDVEEAMSVLKFALTNDAAPEDDAPRRRRGGGGGHAGGASGDASQADGGNDDEEDDNGDGDNDEAGNDDDDGQAGGRRQRRRRERRGDNKKSDKREIDDDSTENEEEEEDDDVNITTAARARARRQRGGARRGGRRGQGRGSQQLDDSEDDDDDNENENENEDEDAKMDMLDEMPNTVGSSRKGRKTKKRSSQGRDSNDNNNNSNNNNENVDTPRRSKRIKPSLNGANVNLVVTTITSIFRTQRATELPFAQLKSELDKQNANISDTELKAIVLHLHNQNRLFFVEESDVIHQL